MNGAFKVYLHRQNREIFIRLVSPVCKALLHSRALRHPHRSSLPRQRRQSGLISKILIEVCTFTSPAGQSHICNVHGQRFKRRVGHKIPELSAPSVAELRIGHWIWPWPQVQTARTLHVLAFLYRDFCWPCKKRPLTLWLHFWPSS